MQLFAITRAGLAALALAVLTLWACLLAETGARRRAEDDARESFNQIRKLRMASPEPLPDNPLRRRRSLYL